VRRSAEAALSPEARRARETGPASVATPAPPVQVLAAAEPATATGADTTGPNPAAARSGTPGRNAPKGWEAWEVGPYVRWPEQRKRVHEFWLMRTFDPVVRTALALIGRMIVPRVGEYAHEDETVAERVNGWLMRLGGPQTVVRQLLSGLWAGYAVVELKWNIAAEWTVTATNLLHPLTFFARYGTEQGIALDPTTGRVEVFRQLPQASGEEPIDFAPERVLYWPAFGELREQVFGASLLEAARPVWFARVRLGNYWNTYCEKIACPTPVIQVPVDTVEDPTSGQVVSAAQYVTDLFASLEPGMAVSLPYTPGQEWHIDQLAPEGDSGRAFDLRLASLEREMWLAMLTPRLLMAEPEHGSRAQATTNLDLFLDVVDGIREEIGEVLEQQLCRRMVAFNIGAEVPPGEWAWEALTDEDLSLLATVLTQVEAARTSAWQRGVPPEADERKLREVFGAVLADAEDVDFAAQQQQGEDAAALAKRVAATAQRYDL